MTFFKSSDLNKMTSAVSALAVCGVLVGGLVTPGVGAFSGAALAQSSGAGNDNGANGSGGQGSQSGQDNQGAKGSGQGGPDASSDGKGPQASAPSDTTTGGKPAWAQEGIEEVELGRLSVARSPDQVLDRAYTEALATITPEIVAFYSLSLDQMIDELSLNWDNVTIYDSPLQNLALLKDSLDGTSGLIAEGVTNSNDTLLAVFLGVASDKVLPITAATVTAVTTILGTPITGDAAIALATDAEAIRIAVLAGHG
ncbi:hypothetical protein ACEN2J_18435 [Pseudorhodobacter sp. W20_MBD10_FR17]|uniref:hypothetical protein n=1 Tax=Pseudorhodobacter sp. W20_MBD10_FR17 TaxID=3240266 RepID=UPI003F9C0F6B